MGGGVRGKETSTESLTHNLTKKSSEDRLALKEEEEPLEGFSAFALVIGDKKILLPSPFIAIFD